MLADVVLMWASMEGDLDAISASRIFTMDSQSWSYGCADKRENDGIG